MTLKSQEKELMTLMKIIGLFLIQTLTANRPSASYKEGCTVHKSLPVTLKQLYKIPKLVFLNYCEHDAHFTNNSIILIFSH